MENGKQQFRYYCNPSNALIVVNINNHITLYSHNTREEFNKHLDTLEKSKLYISDKELKQYVD